jgi:hypothetical protein
VSTYQIIEIKIDFTPKTPMICNTVGSGTLYKLPENQKCEPGSGKKTLVRTISTQCKHLYR